LPPVRDIHITLREKKNKLTRADGQLEIITKSGKQVFDLEIKGVLKRPMPAHLATRKRYGRNPLLIMSQYVNPSIAADLRENNIYFIDIQGNAWIHIPDILYIDKEGKAPNIPEERRDPSIFYPKGMQLLYTLLIEPNRINNTVRELASAASISKDRVSSGLREMRRNKMIYRKDRENYAFVDRKKMLEDWLTNYGDRFRSSLLIGNYKATHSAVAKIPILLDELFKNQSAIYAITGGLAADMLINYYRGPTTEIFIAPDKKNIVVKELNLLKAKNTNISLLKYFADNIRFDTVKPLAHPLLIYAELLYRGGSRAIETASLIYDRYLKPEYDEN